MDKFEMYIRGPLYGQPKQHTVLADPWLDVVLCCFLLKFFIFEQGDLNALLYTGPHKLHSGSYVHKILCMMPIRITKYLFQAFLWWSMHAQSRSTFRDPMDYRPPGSSVHGILQARILDRVAISFSRGSSRARDLISVSCISSIGRRFFTIEPNGKIPRTILLTKL